MFFFALALSSLTAIVAGQPGNLVTPCARDCFSQAPEFIPAFTPALECNQVLVNFVFTCSAPFCSAAELASLADFFTNACTTSNLPPVVIPVVTPAPPTHSPASATYTPTTPASSNSSSVPATPETSSVAVKYTTLVVSEYTTRYTGPATVTHDNQTYTVISGTVLTVSDCPCTVTTVYYPTSSASSAVHTTLTTTTSGSSATGSPAPSSSATQAQGSAAGRRYSLVGAVVGVVLGVFAAL